MSTTCAVAAAVMFSAVAGLSVSFADETPEPSQQLADLRSDQPEPADWVITGIDEMRFNPRRGSLAVEVGGVGTASEPSDVWVHINDKPLPREAIRVSRHRISVDYRFDDGVNDVLVQFFDRNGSRIRADGLYWSGSRTLVVDVVDAGQLPVVDATVTVRLGAAHAIRLETHTVNGVAWFENLPGVGVVIEVRTRDGHTGRVPAAASQGSVLVTVDAGD